MDSATPIADLLPRPTADQQKELLERIATGGEEKNVDNEVDAMFDVS